MTARRSTRAHACGPQAPEQGKLPTNHKRPAENALRAADAERR